MAWRDGKGLLLGLGLLLGGFANASTPPDGPTRVDLPIETAQGHRWVKVEVVADWERRQRGLMGRAELAPDAGMLFLFEGPQSADAGFWMFRTLLPLDIAFLDQKGRILAIRQMTPCPSPDPTRCPLYRPGVPYRAALEVNLGYFAAHGVRVGDRVDLGVLEGWP